MHLGAIATTAAAVAPLTALQPNQLLMPCPAIPTCPRWAGCIGTSRDGSQYQMRCGIDFNGNIISTTQGRVFTDCADACAANPSCTAYNMKDNFCYLLGDVTGTPRNSTTVHAGIQVKAALPLPTDAGSCGSTVDCPSDDGCSYTANNEAFTVRCMHDYYGGDMLQMRTKDLTDCVDVCANIRDCVAVSWVDEMCYLKDGTSTVLYNNFVDSAYLHKA